MRAIVTGANGFVGLAVCKELSFQGAKVIAIIKDENENVDNIKNIPELQIVYCDLSNIKNLPLLIQERNFDVFYHFAWAGSAGPLRGDCETQINNVKYSCDAVKACAELCCKRFIFASSIMEYEISKVMETENIPGISTLYSSAKIAADYMSRTIAGNLNIEYIRAIISNIYGPGETSPRLINSSIRKMLKGEHCSFSSGDQMYDFIFITDAAKIFALLGSKGKSNRTYYIGNLEPQPLKSYLKKMRNVIDPNIEIGLGEIKFDGNSVDYAALNLNAVLEDTGYSPTVRFEIGIKETVNWIKEKMKHE